MFAVNTYEEIERIEKELHEEHIIILLFVRPSLTKAKEIIDEFDYMHYNSDHACSIYAVGYTNDDTYAKEHHFQKVNINYGTSWFFSNLAFVNFKNNLEKRLKWRYSGDIELLILQSNPNGKQILNFQNYITIDIDYGIKQGYIDSFPRFMESIIRSSRCEKTVKEAMKDTRKQRLSIHKVMLDSIDECKKIPTPIKIIMKDHLFNKKSSHDMDKEKVTA